MREAYYGGEIGEAKVRHVIRVWPARDTKAWAERAKAVEVGRLEQEVQVVLLRVDLADANLLPMAWNEDAYAVLPEGTDLVRLRAELAEVATATKAKRDEAYRARYMTAPAVAGGVQMGSGRYTAAPAEAGQVDPGRYTAASGEPTHEHVCCCTRALPERKEPMVSVSFRAVPEAAKFFLDALEACRVLAGRKLADWQCADIFLDGFFAAYARLGPKRFDVKYKALVRDGFRCQVPGCSGRCRLNGHHAVFLSRNGPNILINIITVCERHHGLIHKGYITVTGTAPHGLIWRIGVTKDGGALLVVGPGGRVLNAKPHRRVTSLDRMV